MSASEIFGCIKTQDFEYLIVDEACQATELTCLIPFIHEPHKIILVGDQMQLPATVMSKNAMQTRYSRSLFERFIDAGVPSYMLSVQYRMHPQIRKFPSDYFYNGNLVDSDEVKQRNQEKYLQLLSQNLNLKPTMMFNLAYGKETQNQKSKTNLDEANFVQSLLLTLATAQPSGNLSAFQGKIGIISPYKEQVNLIRRRVNEVGSKLRINASGNQAIGIEINTVDAFQGREKEIILISTVRTEGLGFLNDLRRMNVAVTRAKSFVWVVGNSQTLKRNEGWAGLLKAMQKSYNFTDTDQTTQQKLEKTLREQNVQTANEHKKRQDKLEAKQQKDMQSFKSSENVKEIETPSSKRLSQEAVSDFEPKDKKKLTPERLNAVVQSLIAPSMDFD